MKQQIFIHEGDCLDGLSQISDGRIDCVVTSPPYFGLRDNGIPDQLGLEERAPAYVKRLVSIFSEVYRVLNDKGVAFVNMGDTYAGFKDGKFPPHSKSGGRQRDMPIENAPHRSKKLLELDGFRNKELMGIPWLFAFSMRDAGWYLRQEIVWAKPNYTPEKVRDRFVRSHEKIFLFTKSDKYFFDGDAVRIPSVSGTKLRSDTWVVPVSKSGKGHFSTYPPELIAPCILAGCPEGGLVLDPFAGSGTTGEVALAHGRRAVLMEINPANVSIIRKRLGIE